MSRSFPGAGWREACETPLTGGSGAVVAGELRVEMARSSEIPALVELDRVCFGRRAWPPAGWLQAVTDPEWTTTVIRFAGRTVAAAVLLPWTPTAHLASIGVHPQLRNRKVGTRLLRDALARARAAGSRFLALEVDVANRGARRFYAREGFGLVRRFREDGRWRVELHRRLGSQAVVSGRWSVVRPPARPGPGARRSDGG